MDKKTQYELVMYESQLGAEFAEWFERKIIQEHMSEDHNLADLDDIIGAMQHRKKQPVIDKRKQVLYYFQRDVIISFGDTILNTAGYLEELLESDDHKTLMTYKTYKEFMDKFPFFNVISMFPTDMNGTFGFMVIRNNMTNDSIECAQHAN